MGFMFRFTIYACIVAIVYILMGGMNGENKVLNDFKNTVSDKVDNTYDEADDEIQDIIDNINDKYIEPLQLQVQKM